MERRFSMDRRAYLKTVGAAGASAAVAGCQGGGSGSDDTIVPGTASGFPPFEYTQDGELVGFDVALAEETIDRAGYEVGDWVDVEFDSLIPSLTEGDIDLVAAAMTINDERDQTIDFSDPYWESNQAVLVREGGDFQPESTDDLEGQRVGAQSGTTGEEQVQGLIDDGTVSGDDYRQYDNYTLAVEDLENGNVDAVVIDVPVAENFAGDRSVVIAFQIETGEQFGFGLREDDDRIEDVNSALSEIRDDGTYEELVSEYFG
ncbi:basic amino acid ABC transporter substrate-binding protein [Halomicrobium salinisoli]|uniref:basic amino acid ABC transporter substrate-binding protein n=1 Tax=Halomicrobium salinisoli TaxID=2878391 RepID=UPI001CEFC3F0|nr:basic amino acid ABC transporter substrate-binding protein [Halomicrobium salinisoli]